MEGSGASGHWTQVGAGADEDSSSLDVMKIETLSRMKIYHQCSRMELVRKIAEGGQAILYEARVDYPPFSYNSTPVVVKKFKALPGVSQGHFPVELLNSGNVFVCRPLGFKFDNADMSLCMIMDQYSGDLRALIDSQMKSRMPDGGAPFTGRVAFSIIVQVAMGMRSLHGCGISHRDLKCTNILVDRSDDRLISSSGAPDMKFAIAISDFETSDDVLGTEFWKAPEILQCLKERAPLSSIKWQPADIYSFGMTCYEILTGESPFQHHMDHIGFYKTRDLVLDGKNWSYQLLFMRV